MNIQTATAILDAERKSFLNQGATLGAITHGLIRGLRLSDAITPQTEQSLLVHYNLAASDDQVAQEEPATPLRGRHLTLGDFRKATHGLPTISNSTARPATMT